MSVKKTGRKPAAKTKEDLSLTHLPDVFDEGLVKSVSPPKEVDVAKKTLVEETEKLPSPKPPRIVTEIEETPETIPAQVSPGSPTSPATEQGEPTFTVRQNGQEIEQKLPTFLAEGQESSSPSVPEPSVSQDKTLETAVPQAFVSEVREVASEVKRERKGTLVTIFILLGMVLVAGGVVGLFVMNTKKQEGTVTPTASPVSESEATPSPTPTIIIDTESQTPEASVSAEVKKEVKVDVLNGTAIKGLAAKEAANLRKAGFSIGAVGNGEPSKAGTIVVPEGKLALGEEIKAVLANYTFTVSQDAQVSVITVTLGEPS